MYENWGGAIEELAHIFFMIDECLPVLTKCTIALDRHANFCLFYLIFSKSICTKKQ